MIKCKNCGRENVPLYRTSPKGKPANWLCETCKKLKGQEIDMVTRDIADNIQAAGNEGN